MSGELVKLVVMSFDTEARSGAAKETFSVQFNPTSYSRGFEVEYSEQNGAGNTAGAAQFQRIKAGDFALEFTLDGTGVGGGTPADVPARVQDFLRVARDFDGDIHRPRFLKVGWGTLMVKCVLKSVTLNYTLFKPDGSPLRAKISATFTESQDEPLRTAREDRRSADLTRWREIIQGETLPNLAYRHFADETLYARLARFNDLDDFRDLQPGRTLKFPPLPQLPKPEADDG